jgi:hypothetical protein
VRVDFSLVTARDVKALKSARYLQRQPHEDAVLLTVPNEFVEPLYDDALDDHLKNWQRKGFRKGRIPRSWVPKAKEDVREFVCSSVARFAFDGLQKRLNPPPMIPPKFLWSAWRPGDDLIVKGTYMITPRIPDPMEMFQSEIPVDDEVLRGFPPPAPGVHPILLTPPVPGDPTQPIQPQNPPPFDKP